MNLGSRPHDSYEATNLIRSESVPSLSLYLQEMDADKMYDDVKKEALAANRASCEDA